MSQLTPLACSMAVVAVLLPLPSAKAQSTVPRLSVFFTEVSLNALAPGYAGVSPLFHIGRPETADLNGDGNQDLIVLGQDREASLAAVPQPGLVFLGDGEGHFSPAPASLFPVDTLRTIGVKKALFADFNRDGRIDMFLSATGADFFPSPNEQNRLYLSRSGSGWDDVTNRLPQLSDYSHSSSIGDISGRGFIDIFVGNGYEGLNHIRPYTLLNNGGGQFTMATTNIPAGGGQLLDPVTSHHFTGSRLADLNGDGLPELIIAADAGGPLGKLRHSLILWNRAGVFSENDVTELSTPTVFPEFHTDHDVQAMDLNHDGLVDLVMVGRQSLSFNGWFLQIFINHGNREFVDETAARVPAGEFSGGVANVQNSLPIAVSVQPIDFNGDGAPDFAVEFEPQNAEYLTTQPLIWLNDGPGHFTTLKAGDFMSPGSMFKLGTNHLMATRNGHSFIRTFYSPSSGLTATILLATKPYNAHTTAAPPPKR